MCWLAWEHWQILVHSSLKIGTKMLFAVASRQAPIKKYSTQFPLALRLTVSGTTKLLSQAGLDPTRPPHTIEELNEAMTVLRAKLPDNAYPIALDTSITEYALIGFWPWIWTFGGEPMVDNGMEM